MPDPSKRTIMVVDDDRAIRESIAVFLHAHGYEASSATDGYDALWLLTNGLVDLIVSDLEMPGLSGIEFLSAIRKRYPQILVVAMSDRPDGKSELGSASADAFYVKGQQNPKKLLSTIARLLRESALQGRTQKTESSEVSFTGHRTELAEAPRVLICPECLKTVSILASNGTDRREAREATCIFCETKFRYALASSCSTVPARQATSAKYPKEFGLDNLCDSTRKLAILALRGCRRLWCGLTGWSFHAGPSAGSSIDKASDRESTRQLKGRTQTSPALHGKDREQ